jgi:hypothetical protein
MILTSIFSLRLSLMETNDPFTEKTYQLKLMLSLEFSQGASLSKNDE